MPSLNAGMGSNAIWLLGCRVLADLLNFALFLVVSRRFGPAGMGVYAYGFAIASFVYAAITLGIDEYGIREYTRRAPQERGRLMSDLLGAQICTAAVALLVLAAYLVMTQPTSATLSIIAVLTVYQVCSAFAGTLFVPAMAEQRMAEPAAITLLCRALALVATGVMIWIGTSLQAALSAFAVAGVVMLVLSMRSAASCGIRLRLHVSRDVVRDGARTLWSFAAVDVMSQLFTRIGVIVLSLQIGAAAAGIYATGLKLVEAICLPLLFLGLAAYPKLCQAFHDPAQFERLCRQALGFGLTISAVSALALYLAVPPLLVPVFGAKYAGAEAVIASMGALVFVQAMEIVLGRLLLSANLNVARAAWVSVGALLCVVATLIASWTYGIEGAIVAVVLSYLLVDVLYALSLYGALRRRPLAQVSVQAPP